MKIGIVHLTDIHFSEKADLKQKCISLTKLILNNFSLADVLFFVISGDIAAKGKELEYAFAKDFLDSLLSSISEAFKSLTCRVIIVPGNHDCNFDYDTQIRKNCINNPTYKSLGDDNSVFDACVVVQKDFWNFYHNYNDIPRNKIYYKIECEHAGVSICFHCFNTSWMSQIEEKPGSLFFPVSKFAKDVGDKDYNISISIYHHPLNWFTPETEINNRREFQAHLNKLSSFQIIGHEHEEYFEKLDLYNQYSSSLYFSGAVFNNTDNVNDSGFQLFEINPEAKTGILKCFKWVGAFSGEIRPVIPI